MCGLPQGGSGAALRQRAHSAHVGDRHGYERISPLLAEEDASAIPALCTQAAAWRHAGRVAWRIGRGLVSEVHLLANVPARHAAIDRRSVCARTAAYRAMG